MTEHQAIEALASSMQQCISDYLEANTDESGTKTMHLGIAAKSTAMVANLSIGLLHLATKKPISECRDTFVGMVDGLVETT